MGCLEALMASDGTLVMESISPELAQVLLGCALERISEASFKVAWRKDLSFIVWNWAQPYSDGPLPEGERVLLRGLAACAGGWLCREAGEEDSHLLTLPAWIRTYGGWMASHPEGLRDIRREASGVMNLAVPLSKEQAARLATGKLASLLEGLLQDYWQANRSGTPGGAELLGELVRNVLALHTQVSEGHLTLPLGDASGRGQACPGEFAFA